MGGAQSIIDDPDFKTVQADLADIKSKLSDYPSIKAQVKDIGSLAAKNLNYDNLAAKITDVDAYNRKIATVISDSPGKLGDSLNEKIAQNELFISRIGKLLEDNTTFTNSLATTLTDSTKPFLNKVKGPRGDSGELSSSASAVKDTLYNKKYTVWCADGDVCQLPVGSKGFTSGEDMTLTPKKKVNVVGDIDVSGVLKLGGSHLVNNVNNDEYIRFLSNPQSLDSYNRGLAIKKLHVNDVGYFGGTINANGGGKFGKTTIDGNGDINHAGGTLHINGNGWMHFLNKNGVIVGKEWGGNGDLTVQGNTYLGGSLKIGSWTLTEAADGDLHFVKNGLRGSLTSWGRFSSTG